MEYVRLGSSGLKVSRTCLGMMSYGDPASRTWMLREDAAEPIVRQAACSPSCSPPRGLRARHQGLLPHRVGPRLTGDEVARLEAPYRPHRFLGHD